MIALLVVTAGARPLEDAILPDCAADSTVQLTLGQRILALWFQPDGELGVVDWAGVTLRDPASLDVRARLDPPGTVGWEEARPEPDGTVELRNVIGPVITLVDGEPKLTVNWILVAPWLNPDAIRPQATDEIDGRPVIRIGDPPLAAISDERLLAVEDGHLGRELATLATAPSGADRLAGDARSRLPAEWGAGPPWVQVRAVASDPEHGRIAVATESELVVVDAVRGGVLARRPLVDAADAAGLVGGRLFTVSEGELVIWSRSGAPAWQDPGPWASAVALGPDRLLATTLGGRAKTVDLATGKVKNAACLLAGKCDPRPEELPAIPAPPSDPSALEAWRAAVNAWSIEVAQLRDRTEPHPVQLLRAGEWVVAAELHPQTWRTEGTVAPLALRVLDARGKQVLAEVVLPEPVAVAPRFVAPATVVLGDRAWHLPDLAPLPQVPTPPDGTADVSVTVTDDGFDDVIVGTWSGGAFSGAPGLPSRWIPEMRQRTYASVDDGRVVLGAYGRRGLITYGISGPTEVWCVPPSGVPATSAAPGVIAMPPEQRGRPGHGGQTPDERLRAHLTTHEPQGNAGFPVSGRTSDRPEVWLVVEHPDEATEASRLMAAGHRVRLILPYPPQPGETVPDGVPWDVAMPELGSPGMALVVQANTVLWSGSPSRVPEPAVFRAGPRFSGSASEEMRAAFRAHAESVLGDPSPVAQTVWAIRAARAAGHDAVVQRAAAEIRVHPELPWPKDAVQQAVVGKPFPSGEVDWSKPLGDGWRAVYFPEQVAGPADWEAASAVNAAVTVAVVAPDERVAAQIPLALTMARDPTFATRLGVDPRSWVLVDPAGVVVWTGYSLELAEAVRLRVPSP